ncbi:GNAT family N-acetyltransferase [Spirochaeta isovalerica]|uniref:RimJ/RimL family protein N-acetyltransferase n=1 Tax=Spirochaeta isovalerica TaxID=150 RepID=A0A841RB20_9SPIO|nr:GNAT family protein [Spirochaeta isovalerica]MBB6480447.1 RimJ/RimL family protein N-acetyltransferase [Spirochaeta isovalerica]
MNVIINGEKVQLRKAQSEDSFNMSRWYSDPRIMIHVGYSKGLGISPEDLQRRITNLDDRHQIFIILDENSKAIGECNYKTDNDDIFEIGIKIGECDKQGLGYGKDALSAFIQYLKSEKKARNIVLEALEENKRAVSLYTNAGFKIVKRNKNSWTDPDGNQRSSVLMELNCIEKWIYSIKPGICWKAFTAGERQCRKDHITWS